MLLVFWWTKSLFYTADGVLPEHCPWVLPVLPGSAADPGQPTKQNNNKYKHFF